MRGVDTELIIYLWTAACGAAGGIGRFCRNYEMYKDWKISNIIIALIMCAIIGSVSAMIIVGFYFNKTLIDNRLKAFAIGTAVGYIPVEIPIISQVVLGFLKMKNGK